jgi:hypothetical protein
MSEQPKLTRRAAISGGLGVLALGALAISRRNAGGVVSELVSLGEPAVIGRIRSLGPEALNALSHPSRASLDRELESRVSMDADIDVVRNALAQRCKRDFREGDVLAVFGWQLARTEVLLVAFLFRLLPE